MRKLHNTFRFFYLCFIFLVNGLDYILWEDRKITGFSYSLEKHPKELRKEKILEEEKKNTMAYIDYLNDMTDETEEEKE